MSDSFESSKSSIKLSRNAKGEMQVEVKIYTRGEDEPVEEWEGRLDEAKATAVRLYQELV